MNSYPACQATKHYGDESESSGCSFPASTCGMMCDFKGKVHSSFRIGPLVEVLGNLNEVKEKVIAKMGFSGLLRLPRDQSDCHRPFNLRFAFWLLMKLDAESCVLDLGRRGKIKIENEDVGFVFGIKSWGEELEHHDTSKLEKNKEIIKKNLLLDSCQVINLDTMKEVIRREISNINDQAACKAFMTALLIYAVSCFLAPKGRPARVNTEIFDSILNPDRILELNWSSYVLRTLTECSTKIKADIINKKASVCLDGCLLFLQIAYFDNLKAGAYRRIQYNWPRVADFSYARLKELISLDTCQGDNPIEDRYGNSELIHPAESFYTMGILYRHRLPSGYELEKVVECINRDNLGHKRDIMKSVQQFGNHLCTMSDRYNEEIKHILRRWKPSEIGEHEAMPSTYQLKSVSPNAPDVRKDDVNYTSATRNDGALQPCIGAGIVRRLPQRLRSKRPANKKALGNVTNHVIDTKCGPPERSDITKHFVRKRLSVKRKKPVQNSAKDDSDATCVE